MLLCSFLGRNDMLIKVFNILALTKKTWRTNIGRHYSSKEPYLYGMFQQCASSINGVPRKK